MTAFHDDVLYGVRSLARKPGFSAVVVGALALCIGANTAMFSVVDSVLVKPLPYRDPGRLVYVSERLTELMAGPIPFSAPDYQELVRRSHSFESIGIYHGKEFELSGMESPERVQGARISASLLPLLGISPALGRNFSNEEDAAAHRVVILASGFWRAKFGGDPNVIGREINLDRTAYTIVGVMPAGLTFPLRGPKFNNDPASLYVPMSFTPPELKGFGMMYNHSVVARLRPGVTLAQANQELKGIAHRMTADVYPKEMLVPGAEIGMSAVPFREEVVGNTRPMLLVLFGAVMLVLLIGCADIAGLLLTRTAGRNREISIRTALGATRGQIVRQVLVESLLLALAGGAFGLMLCFWAGGVLVRLTSANLPSGSVDLNSGVFLFTLALSAGTAIIVGLAPALRASKVDVSQGVREGGRGQSTGRKQGRLLDTLVIAQFALALLLLVGAGLLVRSFSHLLSTDPGFQPDHVLSMSVSLPAEAYASGSQVRAFYERLEPLVKDVPGVKTAALSTSLPLSINEHRTFHIQGQPATASSIPHKTAHIWVVGDFFRAIGIPLKRGRFLNRQDTQHSTPVVVINETLANEFWRNQNPIGQQIKWGSRSPWMAIVGVVGDVKQGALNEPTDPETYSPWRQLTDEELADNITNEFRSLTIAVRTANSPSAEAPAIERVIHGLDSSLPVTKVTTMDAELQVSLRSERLQTTLIGGFAIAALVLAALGIGGVLAYSVAQRVSEIGIRMALGASRGQVLRLILARGMKLAGLGALAGLAGALVLTRLMSHVLYETSPYDALTFCAAPAFLCTVGLLAILLPARKAATIDPLESLRVE